jgi:CRISPR system Cascade subunit CasD
MPSLAFYIDAPMLSWGASSKYQFRETEAFPTKSAIVGILAAAIGVDKHSDDEADQLTPLSALRLIVARVPKRSRGRDLDSVRLTDFHTIGGGYDKAASLREKMSIPRKASGAPFGTVITRRTYLTETTFVAILEGGSDQLETVKAALENPLWGIWFGRKTCLPATPLTPTLGDTVDCAFQSLLETLPNHQPQALDNFDYQEEIPNGDEQDGDFFQSDQPIAYGQHHGPVPAAYRARAVRNHLANS